MYGDSDNKPYATFCSIMFVSCEGWSSEYDSSPTESEQIDQPLQLVVKYSLFISHFNNFINIWHQKCLRQIFITISFLGVSRKTIMHLANFSNSIFLKSFNNMRLWEQFILILTRDNIVCKWKECKNVLWTNHLNFF